MNLIVTIGFIVELFDCLFQIFEESTKLQNLRLERQQQLQRKHLKEWKDFAEKYSSDHLSIHSDMIGPDFSIERNSSMNSRVSLGASLV